MPETPGCPNKNMKLSRNIKLMIDLSVSNSIGSFKLHIFIYNRTVRISIRNSFKNDHML